MTMSTLSAIVIKAMNASISAYEARRATIEAAYAEGNSEIPVNVDCLGRFHAPVDGYTIPAWLANNVIGYDDKLFGKGEFLPMPVYGDDEVSFQVWDKNDMGQRVMVNDEQLAELEEAAKTEAFKFSCGGEWNTAQGKQRYAYIVSPSKRIPNLIKVYFATAQEEAKKALEEKWAAEKAAAGTAPTGRQAVKGTVLSVKAREDYYGITWKMMVKLENGSTVYGTVPSSLPDFEAGAVVEFTATFEHSEGDEKHAFYKRPTKAKLLDEPVVETEVEIEVEPVVETEIEVEPVVETEAEPVIEPAVEVEAVEPEVVEKPKAKKIKKAKKAATERKTVQGKLLDVITVKGVKKMYVLLENDYIVYGTFPAGVGDMIEFAAAFDSNTAMFSRPTKAKLA